MRSFCSPTRLRNLLNQIGSFPKKSLSQNFLIDGNILSKIIDAASVQEEEEVLEVGSGSGFLTEALLEKKANLTAVEKDPVFANHLRSLQKEYPNLKVYEEDFLQFSLEGKFSKKIKMVANLPYHITSELFLRFFSYSSYFSTLILMVQKEAAARILSSPSTKSYGPLSLLTAFYSKAQKLFDIPHSCFYPAPKVDSTLLQLHIERTLPQDIQKEFHRMVFRAFQQRRKKITSSLKELYPPKLVQESLLELHYKEEARPEELTSSAFFHLFSYLQKKKRKTLSTDEKKSDSHPLLQKEESA